MLPKNKRIVVKTQKQRVWWFLKKNKPQCIKEVSEGTNIKEPNVRRILGVGTKEGEFKRIAKGVYTIDKGGEQYAWVQCGDALDVLPQLVDEGKKFDMIFLDPAYFSKALISGNRKIIDYEFMSHQQFGQAMKSIQKLIKNDDSHIYLMLSGSPSAQADMQNYYDKMTDVGLKKVDEGHYKKLYKNGRPVINLRGKEASPERLILFTKSGIARTGETPTDLKLSGVRPFRKYKTEKAPEFINAVIKNSTHKGESVLDPFAGSGVTGAESLKLGRKVGLIEICDKAVSNHIIPRINKI